MYYYNYYNKIYKNITRIHKSDSLILFGFNDLVRLTRILYS